MLVFCEDTERVLMWYLEDHLNLNNLMSRARQDARVIHELLLKCTASGVLSAKWIRACCLDYC